MEYDDNISIINVTEGGKLNDQVEIGMTYNELKKILDMSLAYVTFSTYDTSVDVEIDGVKWSIAFELTEGEKKQLGLDNISLNDPPAPFDLSEINPKSTMGYYFG